MSDAVNFLGQAVLSSKELKGKQDKGYVKTLIELKLAEKPTEKKPEEVTYADLIKYAQRRIKPGLKSVAFHKRAIFTIREIFLENDPTNADVFTKLLPAKLQQVA